MDSLLVNLRKYRPRDKSDPLENFVTEAFAWLLRNSDDAVNGLIELVNENIDNPVSNTHNNLSISTQENFAGKYPDMVFTWPRMTMVFEHKVWSELHQNQLKNYRNYISEKTEQYRIILITARTYQHKQKEETDVALCWYEIYKMLDGVKQKQNPSNSQLSWAITDFLALLHSEGLGPPTPINSFAIEHYQEAIQLEEQLNHLIQQATHLSWPMQTETIKCIAKNKAFGRLGLEFSYILPSGKRQWLPGIFCGFLLDGKDHKANDLLEDGLKVAVILDLNEIGQKFYPTSDLFNRFIQELRDLIAEHQNGWQFSDRTSDTNIKLNKWHPLILTKSLTEMFGATGQLEEQVALFHSEICEIQNLILKTDNYSLFCTELVTSLSNENIECKGVEGELIAN